MESKIELRKRFVLIPLAPDHLVKQIHQPVDSDNFQYCCHLIVLLPLDDLALLRMIDDTLLSKRDGSIVNVTTKSGEDSLIVLVFSLRYSYGY